MGKIDEDGYFFIVDRKKELIIRGGYNVYPREIEEVLYEHEGVLEAAVIGVPDESMGEEVGAAVVLKEGEDVSADDLRAYVKEQVANYKYPRKIWFVDELPEGPDGQDPQARDRGARGGQDGLMARGQCHASTRCSRTPAAGRPAAGSRAWRARSSPPGSRRGPGRSRAAGVGLHAASWRRSRSGSPTSRRRRRTAASRTTAWRGNPAFRRLAQAYLATGRTVDELICDAGLDERAERRVRFAAENVLDALAPTNFPATNPAVLKATLDTGGRNLVQGTANLVARHRRAAAHPVDGRRVGVHGRRGPRADARRRRAADRAVRADPVRAEHAEGARDAAAARPADDQQVLHRRPRARPQHARVLRRRGPAVLHDLLAQPGRAPRRLGPRRLRAPPCSRRSRRSRRSPAPSART